MDREQLEKDGWQMGTVAAGERLKQWVAEHEAQGLDVYLEQVPFVPMAEEGCGTHCGTICTVCFGEPQFRAYVRQKSETQSNL